MYELTFNLYFLDYDSLVLSFLLKAQFLILMNDQVFWLGITYSGDQKECNTAFTKTLKEMLQSFWSPL